MGKLIHSHNTQNADAPFANTIYSTTTKKKKKIEDRSTVHMKFKMRGTLTVCNKKRANKQIKI